MHELLVNHLFKPVQEKVWSVELNTPPWPQLLTWDIKQQNIQSISASNSEVCSVSFISQFTYPPKLLGGILSYFTVMILVKFFKDFYSHHDVGCYDNQKEKNFWYLLVKDILAYFTKLVSKRVLPHGEGPYCAVIKPEHSNKLYLADLKIIWHIFYLMILGQDSSNHIGPLKTLPLEYFVCIYWEKQTKFSAETYEWVFLKIKWICTVSNAHISLWLYKMCQTVATIFLW